MDSIGFYCAGFPDHRIVDAYLKPTVDDSKEAFSWALPDLDILREYPWPSNEENKNKSVYIKDTATCTCMIHSKMDVAH